MTQHVDSESNAELNIDLYIHLLGPRAWNKYERKFTKFAAGGSPVNWNWACFLFGGFWMFYRQLNGLLVGYLLILSAAAHVLTAMVGTALAFLPFYLMLAKVICPAFVDFYMYKRISQFVQRTKRKGDNPLAMSYRNKFASINRETPNNPRIF